MEKTLHEALAEVVVTSKPGTIPGKRALYLEGNPLGEFDAYDAWRMVHTLSSKAVISTPTAA